MRLLTKQLRPITYLSIFIASTCVFGVANAQSQYDTFLTGGAGLNLGLTFSEKFKPQFTIGAEVYLIQHITEVDDDNTPAGLPTFGVGPVIQFSLSPKNGLKSTLAVTGGISDEYYDNPYMGELGVTYNFKHNDWGLRVGAVYEPLDITIAARHDFFMGETMFSVGGRDSFESIIDNSVDLIEGPQQPEDNE
ncbi:MAG: hypothetical protein HRU38_13600 [Saccharospirillaceae bacterium]|nr:hypothetical protein [Pseudomonadales bacterium]NRB79679.1 hypothetical protein [Saccharospirillaceae bacterium]